MSKPKLKLGSIAQGLKRKLAGLFKKSSKTEDEYYYEDEYEDEEYEEEYEDDQTDPSFQPLTVTDIKRSQIEEGELPPDLPELMEESEDDYYVEDDPIHQTSPSLHEFETPKASQTLKSKLLGFSRTVKDKLKTPTKANFNLKNIKGAGLEKFINKVRDINFDEIFDQFFSPQNRPQVHRFFLASLFILGSYFTGRMISSLLSPVSKGRAISKGSPLRLNQNDVTRNHLASLKSNDLFQAPEEGNTPTIRDTQKKPDFKEVKICDTASERSSLTLKLVNTVILQDSVKSMASVQIRGKENFLRVGDSIPNVIEVGNISRQKLIFKNLKTRKCEYIENVMPQKNTPKKLNIVSEPKKAKQIIKDSQATGISQVGNTFKIKKEVRSRMLENISEVLTQARAVQIKNPDGSLAFRMQEIVPGSIYSQLNIQEGDTITGINGNKITNMAELMNLFGQIDKVDHFELTLNRDGIDQNLEYDFE